MQSRRPTTCQRRLLQVKNRTYFGSLRTNAHRMLFRANQTFGLNRIQCCLVRVSFSNSKGAKVREMAGGHTGYDGPTPVTPYHVVEVHYYEGVSWLILNAEGRQWQVVRSRPLFSPNLAWFATAWIDLEAGFDPRHLDIWAVEADSVRRVLALDGGMEWGAVDPHWPSSDRLEYLRLSWRAEPTSGMWFDTVATGVTRHDAEWVPDSLPGTAR